MRITIGVVGEQAVDVTRRLIADSDIEITHERERDAFERVVSDITLVLGNLDGGVTAIFSGFKPQTAWDVEVYDESRRTFWGRIYSPVTTDFKEKVVKIRAFSIDRAWIDLCKITTIPPWKQTNQVYSTLGGILHRVLLGEGRPLTQLGISTIEIDPLYQYRKIRDQAESKDPLVSNYGRFDHLDSTTTVKELLDAFCIYYNAEFLVDPTSGAFCMRQRRTILIDTEHDLDAIIMSDGAIESDDTDQKKYDYIKISVGVPTPEQPEDTGKLTTFKSQYAVSAKASVSYAYSNVIQSGGIEIETPLSDPFQMNYENMYLNGQWLTIAPKFVIPVPPAGTIKQNIYRLYNDEAYLPFTSIVADPVTRIFAIDPKLEFDGGKLKQWIPLSSKMDFNRFGNIYLQYDEELGKWNDNLIEAADNPQPKEGSVFEVKPILRFYNTYRTAINDYSLVEMFYFFGAEINVDDFKSQWIDLFRTRRPIRCTVKGTNYKYGDSFISAKKLPGKYVVKKAVNREMKKETELELLTV